jgi:hypothetical protein
MNRVLPSLVLGWVGSFASWLSAAHPVLSVVATTLAAVASIYAIVVSWRTARLRRLEIEQATQVLCDLCRVGRTPKECPIPEADRPASCPKNPNRN